MDSASTVSGFRPGDVHQREQADAAYSAGVAGQAGAGSGVVYLFSDVGDNAQGDEIEQFFFLSATA